ncbi:MAG: DUF4339 domain-containing protein [Planctomycetota bacterium]|jgi:hypothetical protein
MEQWHYLQDGQQVGPVTKEQLISLFAQQILTPDAMVWHAGMEQWAPANTVAELAGEFAGGITAGGVPAGYAPPRPTSVTVLGILCIVFGGLGLLCTPVGLVAMFMPNLHGGANMYESPAMQAYMFISMGLGLVFAIVELAAGIGLLNLKSWGRSAALLYGWAAIVFGILGAIVNILIVLPAMQQASGGGNPEAVGQAIGSIVGGMCGGIIGLIFPIFLVIYMRKPHVVAACSQ